jgi:hypothetical protein
MRQSPMRQAAPRSWQPEQQRETRSFWRKALSGIGWVMVLAAAAAGVYGTGRFTGAFAQDHGNPPQRLESEAQLGAQHSEPRQNDCTLIVPSHPLTAAGLATPYLLAATNPGNTNCHEATPAEAAFVQAAALDPATGRVSIYNPLVIDQGTQPAAAPAVPTLPADAVVGIWFGANGTGLRLKGTDFNTLTDAKCVNGLGSSIFGQMAYCNAPAFFQTANKLIQANKLVPPALGTAKDGMPCPTVRDFSVVDQDQSDNVTTSYRITQDGNLAQNTAANAAAFPGSVALNNGSDNRLLAVALDSALGCAPWRAPNLADPGQMVPALPLDELQAAMYQQAPVALVPSGDPMTLVNGHPNLLKQNLYRAGVDQPNVASFAQANADQKAYCQDLMSIAPARLELDRQWTSAASSLDPAVANSFFTFLASRLDFTLGPSGLNCTGLLNVSNPVHLTVNDGIVVDATFTSAGA